MARSSSCTVWPKTTGLGGGTVGCSADGGGVMTAI